MKTSLENINHLSTRSARHFILWALALSWLFLSPKLKYWLLAQDGKPIGKLSIVYEETGGIRHNVEDLKYWAANNMEILKEGELYALWGWAFLDIGQDVSLSEYDRFVIARRNSSSLVFSTVVYPRPGAQEAFKDLGLDDLVSSGFYAMISRNALATGTYRVGLLFEHRRTGKRYYTETGRLLVRTPNHLEFFKQESMRGE